MFRLGFTGSYLSAFGEEIHLGDMTILLLQGFLFFIPASFVWPPSFFLPMMGSFLGLRLVMQPRGTFRL